MLYSMNILKNMAITNALIISFCLRIFESAKRGDRTL